MKVTHLCSRKIWTFISLICFSFSCFSQVKNDNLFSKTDSLLRLDQCKEVIKILPPIKFKNNIRLYIQYLRAQEICNNNEYALTLSIKLLKNGNLKSNEKARIHLLNAKLYEKISDKKNTIISLKQCQANISKTTEEDILQLWNVRMSSYYRVMTNKKDSAKYYAKKALQYKSGEVASAYFLNAYLSTDFNEKIYYQKKSIRYHDSINNKYVAASLRGSLARIYKDHKIVDLYEKNFHEAIKILSSSKEDINRIDLYKCLKEFYSYKNNYKMALLYADSLSLTTKRMDSIYNIRQIAILEKKYDNRQNEIKIANISALINEKNKTNNILIALIILFILFSIIIVRLLVILYTKKKLISIKSNLLSRNNKQLRDSLSYNEVLMKENNHRVKNNLMMLAGIMKIETSKTDNELLKNKLTEIENRIHSISTIHKYIYQVNNYSSINIQSVLQDVIQKTKEELIPVHLAQYISLRAESVEMEISKAIPLILIVNELLTNSIKYALHSEDDQILITLSKNKNKIILTINDTGSGYQPILKNKETKTTGLYLIEILTIQLKGELKHYKLNKKFFSTQLVFNL
ncbi:sensor histidine kinase [Algoriella sp.]|uniref:sensor histidine kinase n=1 Tax=Algoriella sp. TaxID=1872434 RepID=UPI002FC91586